VLVKNVMGLWHILYDNVFALSKSSREWTRGTENILQHSSYLMLLESSDERALNQAMNATTASPTITLQWGPEMIHNFCFKAETWCSVPENA
jgi:hypothetical protein